MGLTLLDLPVEIRLNIYNQLFERRIWIIEEGTQGQVPTLFPEKGIVQPQGSRSGQIIRVCKMIRHEAESLLYARTQFCVLTRAFAGRLPTQLTNGSLFASKIKHLTWQLNCDMMKYFYTDDLALSSQDLTQLDTLELRCQSESWRDSFCGEWVDQNAFVRGRNQMVEYAQTLQTMMNDGNYRAATLSENRSETGKKRVVLRLSRIQQFLSECEMIIG